MAFIEGLNPDNPQDADNVSDGAGEIRDFKKDVQDSFPNINAEVSRTPRELNIAMGEDTLSAETSAGATPENYNYRPGDMRRYQPSTPNNNLAYQSAINVASYNGNKVLVPGGRTVLTTTMYYRYDAADNSGFNKSATDNGGGSLIVEGISPTDLKWENRTEDRGSVLDFQPGGAETVGHDLIYDETSPGIDVGHGILLRDLGLVGDTTGQILSAKDLNRFSGLENCFVYNRDLTTGQAVKWTDSFYFRFNNCDLGTAGTNNPAVQIDHVDRASGGPLCFETTFRGGSVACQLGEPASGTAAAMQANVFNRCQFKDADTGLLVGQGVIVANILGCYFELNAERDCWIYNSANQVTVQNSFLFSDASIANLELGLRGGTGTQNQFRNALLIGNAFNNDTALCLRRTVSTGGVSNCSTTVQDNQFAGAAATLVDNQGAGGLMWTNNRLPGGTGKLTGVLDDCELYVSGNQSNESRDIEIGSTIATSTLKLNSDEAGFYGSKIGFFGVAPSTQTNINPVGDQNDKDGELRQALADLGLIDYS